MLRASSSVIEDEALTLSVEVEGIVARYFGEIGLPDSESRAQLKEAVQYIGEWGGDKQAPIRKRIVEMVGNLAGPSARTSLNRLVDAGVLERVHVDTWKNLRNQAAHGARSSASIIELVTACDIVYQLMLLLIFNLVGYGLRFSDNVGPRSTLRTVPRRNRDEGADRHEPTAPFDPTWTGSSGEVT